MPSALQDFEWPNQVWSLSGSPVMLQGLTVFHDFSWSSRFSRRAFKNGEAFTRMAVRAKEANKEAAILLTTEDEPNPRRIASDRYSLIAINVDVIVNATADVASTLVARGHELEALTLSSFEGAVISEPELASFLESRLTVPAVEQWLGQEDSRRVELLEALQQRSEADVPADSSTLVGLLDALVSIDAEVADALAKTLRNAGDRETRLVLLRALTESNDGTVDAGSVFSERLVTRLASAKAEADEYDALVASDTSTETDLQNFIQGHPWLIGLEYEKVTPKQAVVRGALDFILRRYDGCQDIMELKSPQDPIIKAAEDEDGVPPAPHAITLTRPLAQAIAQSHDYRDQLTDAASSLETQYGLKNTRHPKIFIVIGKTANLTDKAKMILTQLNLTLHRVEIIPFDQVGNRAKTIIRNLEHCLTQDSTADDQSPTGNA